MNLIQLTHGADSPLVLHGPGIAAPFRGAAYFPLGDPLAEGSRRARDNWIDDALEIVLENNTPAAISAGFAKLEYFLTLARDYAITHAGSPVYLECAAAAGELSQRSPVMSGWVEIVGGERSAGSVGLRLHVARAGYWEQTGEAQLALALPGGASGLAELTVYNHSDGDAGHWNMFQALAADIAGDLPAPLRLEFRNPSCPAMPKIYFGEDAHPVSGSFLNSKLFDSHFCSGGSASADASCTYGYKTTFTWAGAGEAALGYWLLLAADVGPAGGRYFKPVLRLPGGTGYTDLWLRLRVKDVNDTVIWDGPWALVPAATELVELAPLPAPPNLVELAAAYAQIKVELVAKRLAGGACSLVLDFLQAFPTDTYFKALAKGSGLILNEYLMVDGIYRLLYASGTRTGQFHSDFAVSGDPAPVVTPGVTAQFQILFQHSPTAVDISKTLGVKAFYHPRKRLL